MIITNDWSNKHIITSFEVINTKEHNDNRLYYQNTISIKSTTKTIYYNDNTCVCMHMKKNLDEIESIFYYKVINPKFGKLKLRDRKLQLHREDGPASMESITDNKVKVTFYLHGIEDRKNPNAPTNIVYNDYGEIIKKTYKNGDYSKILGFQKEISIDGVITTLFDNGRKIIKDGDLTKIWNEDGILVYEELTGKSEIAYHKEYDGKGQITSEIYNNTRKTWNDGVLIEVINYNIQREMCDFVSPYKFTKSTYDESEDYFYLLNSKGDYIRKHYDKKHRLVFIGYYNSYGNYHNENGPATIEISNGKIKKTYKIHIEKWQYNLFSFKKIMPRFIVFLNQLKINFKKTAILELEDPHGIKFDDGGGDTKKA